MSGSDDEGTPMTGPLPLELQQIQADTQREAERVKERQVNNCFYILISDWLTKLNSDL